MRVVSRAVYARARQACSFAIPYNPGKLLPVPMQIPCCGIILATCEPPASEWVEAGYSTSSKRTKTTWFIKADGPFLPLAYGIKYCPWCGEELYYQWVKLPEDEKTPPG